MKISIRIYPYNERLWYPPNNRWIKNVLMEYKARDFNTMEVKQCEIIEFIMEYNNKISVNDFHPHSARIRRNWKGCYWFRQKLGKWRSSKYELNKSFYIFWFSKHVNAYFSNYTNKLLETLLGLFWLVYVRLFSVFLCCPHASICSIVRAAKWSSSALISIKIFVSMFPNLEPKFYIWENV